MSQGKKREYTTGDLADLKTVAKLKKEIFESLYKDSLIIPRDDWDKANTVEIYLTTTDDISPVYHEKIEILKSLQKEKVIEGFEISQRFMRGQEERGLLAVDDDFESLELKEDLTSEEIILARVRLKPKAIIEIWEDLQRSTQKISLGSQNIGLDDNKATLLIGEHRCQLPPFKNEHYFCRAMYEHELNEPIDWSSIYEKMTGKKFEDAKSVEKNMRMVRDTMYAVNNRIKATVNTEGDLFKWENKSIKRLF